MARLVRWDPDGVEFRLDDGVELRLTAHDLLECAPGAFHTLSGQRLAPLQDQPDDIRIIAAAEHEDGWLIEIDGAGAAALNPDNLGPYLDPAPLRLSAVPWTAPPAESWITFDYQTYFDDAETRLRCLSHVARYGWARLGGAPREAGEVERFIGSFGYVRETNYGRVFDVRIKLQAENLAYTDRGLEPHTDNPYREPPPTAQVLHCLAASQVGGESRLVDGQGAAEALRRDDPDAFAILTRTPVRFEWSDEATTLTAEAPIIALDGENAFVAIRYNHRSFQAIRASAGERDGWRRAYRKLAAMINAPENGVEFKLAEGEMVIMDNRRILHGRRAYANGEAHERHLQGAYADMDGLLSTLAKLTEQEAARRVDGLEAIFASEAMGRSYGERLSVREHLLQAADLATTAGCSQPLVAASLLHDLGWALADEETAHEEVAAAYLEPIFGPSVSEPVRWHVQAKRYLVAREAGYREQLSDASRQTLERQGGPLSAAEAGAFEGSPAFAQAIALRRMDDQAKQVGRPVRPFADYRRVLRRLAAEQAGRA